MLFAIKTLFTLAYNANYLGTDNGGCTVEQNGRSAANFRGVCFVSTSKSDSSLEFFIRLRLHPPLHSLLQVLDRTGGSGDIDQLIKGLWASLRTGVSVPQTSNKKLGRERQEEPWDVLVK